MPVNVFPMDQAPSDLFAVRALEPDRNHARGGLTAAYLSQLSEPHLLEYFTFQNVFTDGTLFKGVKLLPAGHYLEISLGNGGMRSTQYWDFSFQESNSCRSDSAHIILFGEQ